MRKFSFLPQIGISSSRFGIASLLTAAVLLSLSQPTQAQLGKMIKKAGAAAKDAKPADAAEAAKKAEDVSAATKKKNISIFFSKTKLSSATPQYTTEFQEGDNIYARIVFPKPIKEYLSGNILTFDVAYKQQGDDDYSVNYVKIDASKINQEATQLDFDVLAKPAEATTRYAQFMQAPSLIGMVMQHASPGKKEEFKWKIEDLEGSFFLTMKSAAGFTSFITPIQQKANAFKQDDDASQADLPGEFAEKSYAFNDPQLSKAAIIKFLPANAQVLKFVVGPGDDYKVMKNELGIILYKQTARYIMVAYKDKTSGNCYYDNMIFERPYEGNGKYGSLKVRTNGERIDCSKIK
ncbi:hypothetical protein [Filimonas effusa]|uniref:Uncharacterized protein n=1 Tax=Filimonas effusa TaxID=2508721 RepID=A0A4Q1DA24_9BACT|nr:hypothetical protein [Filimonas effusa]RXK85319.1 hypothetical protein ESB13_00390 [Filimonas effusa]